MEQVTIAEAQARLADLIAAAQRGEEIYIVDGDQALVRLVRTPPILSSSATYQELRQINNLVRFSDDTNQRPERHPQFGSAAGTAWMAEDFDAPLEDFAEYM